MPEGWDDGPAFDFGSFGAMRATISDDVKDRYAKMKDSPDPEVRAKAAELADRVGPLRLEKTKDIPE